MIFLAENHGHNHVDCHEREGIPVRYRDTFAPMAVYMIMSVVFSEKDHSVGPRFVIAPGAGDCVFVFMGTTAIELPLSRQYV